MNVCPELRPDIEVPVLHEVGKIDPQLCREYSEAALPLMLATEGIEMFHVCDKDNALSEMTQLMLDKTVEALGRFDDPVGASVTGYNLPTDTYGFGNENGYHVDGNTKSVAIVSTSGYALLHLAWFPTHDPADLWLGYANIDENTGQANSTLNRTPIGSIEPLVTVECLPGTVVKIEQPVNQLVDSSGFKWEFMHGLYNAQGQRISVQFRDYDGMMKDSNFYIPRVARSQAA